jgi:hypothetical protein
MMPAFIVSSHQGGFTISERHNQKNQIVVSDGELSEVAMKAIAYKILSMIESDRVL